MIAGTASERPVLRDEFHSLFRKMRSVQIAALIGSKDSLASDFSELFPTVIPARLG